MKMKRSKLEAIVREELMNFLGEQLNEADVDVHDAHRDKKSKEEKGGKGEKAAVEPHQTPDNSATKTKGQPPEQELEDEPADDEISKDVADDEAGDEEDIDDAEDDAKSDIADELTGKTVQSITAEPKSKLLPGAMEIVITFNEVTDPFKILVTKSGTVKYFFRGIHNEL